MSNKMTNKFEGIGNFRLRIIYSVLLNRPLEITGIRENEVNPGLTSAEVSFLKLIDQVTNGSRLEISKSGVSLKFFPGVITNNYGNELDFECDCERNISYYLEGLIPISYFGKEPLIINLIGVTNDELDISVDSFKNNICPNLQKLIVGDTVSLEIIKRGMKPIGKGKVKLKCPIVTHLNPIEWVEEGKIKKVYGTAFSTRNSLLTKNIVESGKSVMLKFLPNVWIYEDKTKYIKGEEKSSPGFGLTMTAETNSGFYYSADLVYDKEKDLNAEEISKKCCLMLLDEIYFSGVVDTHSQALFLLFMAISTNQGISRIKLGRISNYTINYLKEIKNLFGVKFKIEDFQENEDEEDLEEEEFEENEANEDDEINSDEEDNQIDELINESNANNNKVIFSCVGIGLRNVARKEV